MPYTNTQPVPGLRHTIACIGDSITHNITLGCAPHLFWPQVLADGLRDDGYRVRARNFGVSGNTSTQMLARISEATMYDQPKVFIVACCVNDPGNGINAATTKSNIRAMLAAVGADYNILASPQYLNWSAGGDSTSAQNATYAALTTAMQEVVADPQGFAGELVFCNAWDWMRDLIVADPVTYAANVWHTSNNNQHLNALGESIYADAVRACIDAQDGWLDALARV